MQGQRRDRKAPLECARGGQSAPIKDSVAPGVDAGVGRSAAHTYLKRFAVIKQAAGWKLELAALH